MMSVGVPFGAAMPNHELASKPGTVSATVGTPGSASERLSVVTASARNWPERICPIDAVMVANPTWTWPAMADLIAGQIPVAFATTIASIEHIRAGQLRPLGVTTLKRSDVLPNIPSISEFVPGYETSSWFGIAAPAGTPADIIETLNRETNAGLADPTIKARLADMGCMVLTGSAADFGKLIADETAKWGKVIRDAGIKAG